MCSKLFFNAEKQCTYGAIRRRVVTGFARNGGAASSAGCGLVLYYLMKVFTLYLKYSVITFTGLMEVSG